MTYTYSKIVSILKPLYNKYSDIRIGIAGSYVNGTQSKNSDIDIVIDGDSMRVDIMEYIKGLFDVTVDVLWVDLMRQEDLELDNLAVACDLPVNKYSVYKTVMREVKWLW